MGLPVCRHDGRAVTRAMSGARWEQAAHLRRAQYSLKTGSPFLFNISPGSHQQQLAGPSLWHPPLGSSSMTASGSQPLQSFTLSASANGARAVVLLLNTQST